MSAQPRVSVIITTYNQQHFITETMDSVLAQTYPEIEVIVTDDCSTDNTPDILRDYAARYPDRIKVALSERNTGIAGNTNRGLALRTGEYTAFLDGDDLFLPEKIEKQVQHLQKHPAALGCYSDAEVFDSETGKTLGLASMLYNGSSEMREGTINMWLYPRYYMIPSTFMLKSSACVPHGFDERLRYKSEVLFFSESLLGGKFLAIREPLARYRRHQKNLTTDKKHRDLSLEYELLVYAILSARYPEWNRVWRRAERAAWFTEALKAHREGDHARYNAIMKDQLRKGEWIRVPAITMGMTLLGNRVAATTSTSTFQRKGWVARLSRLFLS